MYTLWKMHIEWCPGHIVGHAHKVVPRMGHQEYQGLHFPWHCCGGMGWGGGIINMYTLWKMHTLWCPCTALVCSGPPELPGSPPEFPGVGLPELPGGIPELPQGALPNYQGAPRIARVLPGCSLLPNYLALPPEVLALPNS